jgi:hypothetical protein
MRLDGIRKALLEAEGRPVVVHLNDGTRLRVFSREHWMIGPEFLYIVSGRDVHHVAFRNVASIAVRSRRRA